MLLFFHCHKAAGTTVTRAAEASGMKLTEGHRNGNPVNDEGKPLDWTTLNREQTIEKFSGFQRQGVDMVAVEFSFPTWQVLEEVSREVGGLRMFTVLRDPAARALSNYRMDVLNNLIPRDRLFGFYGFMNGASLFRTDNFYTRFFCRIPPKARISRDHLQFAKKKLSGFDQVCVLERGDMAQRLAPLGFREESFGWLNVNNKRRNSTISTPRRKGSTSTPSRMTRPSLPSTATTTRSTHTSCTKRLRPAPRRNAGRYGRS